MSPTSPISLPQIPSPVEGNIARSRSRYKGSRPHNTLTGSSEPPSLSAEQLLRVRNTPLSPRESRPQNGGKDGRGFDIRPPHYENMQRTRGAANDTQRSEAIVAQKIQNSGKAKNRTTSHDEVIPQPQALQDYQQHCMLRRYDTEAESPKGVGQNITRSEKEATSPEQYSRYRGPDLRSPYTEEAAAATVKAPELPRRGLTQRIAGQSNGKRLRKNREELKRTISAPIAIEPPQETAKPAFDAPVSAVNAGERKVNVKYDQNLMSLSVTPSTTPLDIIRSAADHLAESIDPNSTVLLESFKHLGLERPLRRYEHVRDVLNSWDNDMQNTLVIKPSPTGGRDDLLDLHSVSNSQPVDTSACIHYSQRPGHWDKRWVTLRSDGQVLLAKREGGEAANICHVSDFDIYTPTARQLAKRIRPPRKICFAVKSQQKSSMFLSTANFVHFFSTSDKTLAASWYKAVLEWRSWYLVNVMGNGGEFAQSSKIVSTRSGIPKIPYTEFLRPEAQRTPPEPPFQGRSLNKASTLANHNTEHIVPFRNSNSRGNVAEDSVDDTPLRRRSLIQTAQSEKVTKDADIGAPGGNGPSFAKVVRAEEPETFAATGLLGRSYTQRQRAQREREKTQDGGQSQLAEKSNVKHLNSLSRNPSPRPKPKPLIDLTPQYQEPPQHAKRGRGVVLEQIPAGGLVEVANTPEAAIPIPPSTTWRRPISRGRDGPSVGRSRTVRRDHSHGAPSELKQTSTSPKKGEMAFTGGLLASNSRGQGGALTGRAVMTGDRQTKESMPGVVEERQYAPGSLLERIERQDGGSHPTMEKKRDIFTAVGEGVKNEK